MILIFLILFSLFSFDTTQNMEGYTLQNTVSLDNIYSVRNFLEEMYNISTNMTEKAEGEYENTICYKCTVLGEYIPNQLGKQIENITMEELWKKLGAATICPPNGECTEDNEGSQKTDVVAILSSQKDYFMLMQLCTSANALIPFISSRTNPIWKYNTVTAYNSEGGVQLEPGSTSVVPNDVCLRYDPSSTALTGQITVLYNKIRQALEYFHFQMTKTNTGKNGDTWETRTY